MDDIALLLAVLVGVRVLLMLVARVAHVDGPPGWPLGMASREEFWRRTLPWPRGVQEDSEIAWHVPRPEPPPAPDTTRPRPAGRAVPPTRPQPRFIGR
jgi:hypothetical protein